MSPDDQHGFSVLILQCFSYNDFDQSMNLSILQTPLFSHGPGISPIN